MTTQKSSIDIIVDNNVYHVITRDDKWEYYEVNSRDKKVYVSKMDLGYVACCVKQQYSK